jgi:hypothetical protein
MSRWVTLRNAVGRILLVGVAMSTFAGVVGEANAAAGLGPGQGVEASDSLATYNEPHDYIYDNVLGG